MNFGVSDFLDISSRMVSLVVASVHRVGSRVVASAQSCSGADKFFPSFALQSHPDEEEAHATPFASPGHEILLSIETVETCFNPLSPDPDVSLVNLALQLPTAPDTPAQEARESPAHEEHIPQIAYEGDEAKGTDVSAFRIVKLSHVLCVGNFGEKDTFLTVC